MIWDPRSLQSQFCSLRIFLRKFYRKVLLDSETLWLRRKLYRFKTEAKLLLKTPDQFPLIPIRLLWLKALRAKVPWKSILTKRVASDSKTLLLEMHQKSAPRKVLLKNDRKSKWLWILIWVKLFKWIEFLRIRSRTLRLRILSKI